MHRYEILTIDWSLERNRLEFGERNDIVLIETFGETTDKKDNR